MCLAFLRCALSSLFQGICQLAYLTILVLMSQRTSSNQMKLSRNFVLLLCKIGQNLDSTTINTYNYHQLYLGCYARYSARNFLPYALVESKFFQRFIALLTYSDAKFLITKKPNHLLTCASS